MLRVPGVVQLFDEGRDGDDAFLVMELIDGVAFPGRSLPSSWSDVAPTVISLLETLALVHAHGVVHRDLKPSNVFVDANGRPTLLDFGIALDERDATLTGKNETLGTPAYLAPEQFAGEPVGPAADLYALGTMLYETLSGDLPFGRLPRMATMFARAFRVPPPLLEVAPDVPGHVAEVVDSMLRRSPADRPRSAGAVIELLRGRLSTPPSADAPVIVDANLVSAILARAQGGQAVDVVGPPDAGHFRALRAAAEVFAAAGQEVLYLERSHRPFAALTALVSGATATEGLDAVAQRVENGLRTRLRGGAVVVAEHVEAIDRWSRGVLDRVRGEGLVMRGFVAREGLPTDAIEAHPLDDASLRALIAGPDRILHLKEDGARLLRARTGGHALGVEREVRRWLRAGLARWDGSSLTLRRDDLARIEAEPQRPTDPTHSAASSREVGGHHRDILVWIVLAWPVATTTLLSAATGTARWEIEAAVAELMQDGLVYEEPDGSLMTAVPLPVAELWPAERIDEAHRALGRVTAVGTEGRMRHLLAGSSGRLELLAGVVAEAVAVTRQLTGRGLLGRAEAILRESLMHLRRHGAAGAELEAPLLAAWVDVALAQNTPHAIDRVLYELSRAEQLSASHHAMEALSRAALSARTNGEHALALANSLPFMDDPRLEWWRHSVRVIAARRCSQADEEQVLADVAVWADGVNTPEAAASLAGWRARLRYRQGRFVEAAELWLEAMRGETLPERQLSAMTGAASGLMEAARLDEAGRLAHDALDAARAARHVYFEARAEWLVRAVYYRRCQALQPDEELVAVVGLVGVSDLEALVCLTEAAVAWRVGQTETCARLASRVSELWRRSGWSWPVVLPQSLELVVARTDVVDQAKALMHQAVDCPIASVGIQALGLLAFGFPQLREGLRAAIEMQAKTVDRHLWEIRMEVISVREALVAVGVHGGGF